MRKVIFALVLMLVIVSPVVAQTGSQLSSGVSTYLHVVPSKNGDFFQFDETGLAIPQSSEAVRLKEGYIVLAGQQPVVIQGPFTTIALQPEALLTVGKTQGNNTSFYLVAGSASFLVKENFTGFYEVATPVGFYRLNGPGEMFITSDFTEIIFSLGGVIRATNAITRQITDLSPFHYLNMADPMRTQKQISRDTYQTLSIDTTQSQFKNLPSPTATDSLRFVTPSTELLAETKVELKEEPIESIKPVEVAKPVETVKPVEIIKPVETVKPVESVKEVVEVVEKEPMVVEEKDILDFYIVHTADILGEIEQTGIGFDRLATLLKWARSETDNILVLDAGNDLSGKIESEAFEGEPVVALFDMLGYDAIAPALGDFDYGLERIAEIAEAARAYTDVAVLGANLTDAFGNALLDTYKIYNFDDFKVGVIGVAVDAQFDLNQSLIAVGQQIVDEVRKEADFVVVLGNFAATDELSSRTVAATVDGIDLIIDGSGANIPSEGLKINNTLIVSSQKRLESVGVVAAVVENHKLVTLYPLQIETKDVNNVEDFYLAQQFGIKEIPSDAEVATFVENQIINYLALQQIREEDVEIPVEVATVATDDAITIKEPLGIISSEDQKVESSFDFGVATTFNVSRDSFYANRKPKIGFSVNPFINHKNFALGLQAFFMTEGSLFNINSYDDYSKIDNSSTLSLVGSALRFIDYVRYGVADDSFYLLADDKTPINFGKRILVNNLSVDSGPFEEKLGFYTSAKLGLIGLEAFFDNLYLNNWIDDEQQTAAIRVSINPQGAFEGGLSSIIQTDLKNNHTLYPAIDLTWRIKNERRLGVDLFLALATKIDLNNFALTDLFDSSGSSIDTWLPNYLITSGLDIRTLSWNFRVIAAAQNRQGSDNLLTLGSLNSTNYSSQTMLEEDIGTFLIFGGEAAYSGKHFGFNTSWYAPLKTTFNEFVRLEGESTTGDVLAVETSYKRNNFEAALGFRRVGFLSAAKSLLNFSLDNLENFFLTDEKAQPYIALKYTKGIFSIFGDFSLVDDSGSGYVSRINLGSTVTVGKKALKEALDPKLSESAFGVKQQDDKKIKISGSAEVAYTRTFSTDNHLSVKPLVTFTNDKNFSIGLGPKITIDLDSLDLYALDKNQFSFGSGFSSSVGKIYDIATDVFSLIDHVKIGDDSSAFSLNLSQDQNIFFGALVNDLNNNSDLVMSDNLALTAKVATKVFKFDAFVNDLRNIQLTGFRFGFVPFNSYAFEIGLSTIGSLELDSNKRFMLLPALDIKLPIVDKDSFKVAAKGSVTGTLGIDNNKFEQFSFATTGNFFDRFNNFVVNGALEISKDKFSFDVGASAQKGNIYYGMFNALYQRERSTTIIGDIDTIFAGSTEDLSYTANATVLYEGEKFEIKGSYMLPLSKGLKPDFDEDLFSFGSTLKLKWVDLSVAYSRRDIVGGAKDLFGSTSNIASSIKNFFINDETVLSASASLKQGPLSFTTTVSSSGTYTPTSWNGQNYNNDANLAITFKANINLF